MTAPRSPEEEASVRLLWETYQRWDGMPPVTLHIQRTDLHTLLLACQTMTTHPHVSDRMKETWERLGRAFQETLCDAPEIYALTEAGWDRALDVEPEGTNRR